MIVHMCLCISREYLESMAFVMPDHIVDMKGLLGEVPSDNAASNTIFSVKSDKQERKGHILMEEFPKNSPGFKKSRS